MMLHEGTQHQEGPGPSASRISPPQNVPPEINAALSQRKPANQPQWSKRAENEQCFDVVGRSAGAKTGKRRRDAGNSRRVRMSPPSRSFLPGGPSIYYKHNASSMGKNEGVIAVPLSDFWPFGPAWCIRPPPHLPNQARKAFRLLEVFVGGPDTVPRIKGGTCRKKPKVERHHGLGRRPRRARAGLPSFSPVPRGHSDILVGRPGTELGRRAESPGSYGMDEPRIRRKKPRAANL